MNLDKEEKKLLKDGIEIGYFAGKADMDELAKKVEKPKDYVTERIPEIIGKTLKIDKEYANYKKKINKAFSYLKKETEESFERIRKLEREL